MMMMMMMNDVAVLYVVTISINRPWL